MSYQKLYHIRLKVWLNHHFLFKHIYPFLVVVQFVTYYPHGFSKSNILHLPENKKIGNVNNIIKCIFIVSSVCLLLKLLYTIARMCLQILTDLFKLNIIYFNQLRKKIHICIFVTVQLPFYLTCFPLIKTIYKSIQVFGFLILAMQNHISGWLIVQKCFDLTFGLNICFTDKINFKHAWQG